MHNMNGLSLHSYSGIKDADLSFHCDKFVSLIDIVLHSVTSKTSE